MSTSTLDDIQVRPPSPRPPNHGRPVALLVAGAVLAVAVGSGLALTRADRPGSDAGAPTQPTTTTVNVSARPAARPSSDRGRSAPRRRAIHR